MHAEARIDPATILAGEERYFSVPPADSRRSGSNRYTMSAQCMRSSEVGGRATAEISRFGVREGASGVRSAATVQSKTATTTAVRSSTVDFWTVSILPSFFPQLQSCLLLPGPQGTGAWLSACSGVWPVACWCDARCWCADVSASTCATNSPCPVATPSVPQDAHPLSNERKSQQQNGTATTRRRVTRSRNGPPRCSMALWSIPAYFPIRRNPARSSAGISRCPVVQRKGQVNWNRRNNTLSAACGLSESEHCDWRALSSTRWKAPSGAATA